MSGPIGSKVSPHGNWIVVGGLRGGKVVLAKDQTVIVAPMTDLRKVADYDIKHLLNRKRLSEIMKEMKNGEKGRETTEATNSDD